MASWAEIRKQAADLRAWAQERVGGAEDAESILAGVDELAEFQRGIRPPDSSLLHGADAVLEKEAHRIWTSSAVPARWVPVYQAHEYGHYYLGTDCSGGRIDPDALDGDSTSAPLGYSPEEQREREADVFGFELVLATDRLLQWFVTERDRPAAIAKRAGVPIELVLNPLSRAVLSLATDDRVTHVPAVERELDDSQKRAAHAVHGPTLVVAGPGTGKTRTLVDRIAYLLAAGVPAGHAGQRSSGGAAFACGTRSHFPAGIERAGPAAVCAENGMGAQGEVE